MILLLAHGALGQTDPPSALEAWSAPRSAPPAELLRASVQTDRGIVQVGHPVWVDFLLSNLTDETLTLRVPGVQNLPADLVPMGLPVEHIFSGRDHAALSIVNIHGDAFDQQVRMPPRDPVHEVQIAPRGSVGVRLELTQYYPALTRPGKYTILWQPYDGTVISEPLNLQVLPEKQAVITTEFGRMTLRFYYEEAPNHVQNFIELIEQKFYDGLTFNRVVPGGLVQGGDPRGDRRGIRPDGKRLKAEFSNIPFELGTMGMARSPRDPDSASCQFYICLARQPSFDGRQTAFGYLVGDESFETLRRIASVPTTTADEPRQPVYIRAISLENVPARPRDLEIAPRRPNPLLGNPPPGPQPSSASDTSAATPPAPPTETPAPPPDATAAVPDTQPVVGP